MKATNTCWMLPIFSALCINSSIFAPSDNMSNLIWPKWLWSIFPLGVIVKRQNLNSVKLSITWSWFMLSCFSIFTWQWSASVYGKEDKTTQGHRIWTRFDLVQFCLRKRQFVFGSVTWIYSIQITMQWGDWQKHVNSSLCIWKRTNNFMPRVWAFQSSLHTFALSQFMQRIRNIVQCVRSYMDGRFFFLFSPFQVFLLIWQDLVGSFDLHPLISGD